MNRMLCAALGALCVLASAEQQASAYTKFNFGIGANISWEGANNSLLWGALRGGPAPGAVDGYGAPGFGVPPGGHAGINPPAGAYPLAQGSAPADPNVANTGYPNTNGTQPKPLAVPPLAPAPQMPKAADAQPVGYWTAPAQYPYGHNYNYYPYQPLWYGYGYGY